MSCCSSSNQQIKALLKNVKFIWYLFLLFKGGTLWNEKPGTSCRAWKWKAPTRAEISRTRGSNEGANTSGCICEHFLKLYILVWMFPSYIPLLPTLKPFLNNWDSLSEVWQKYFSGTCVGPQKLKFTVVQGIFKWNAIVMPNIYSSFLSENTIAT